MTLKVLGIFKDHRTDTPVVYAQIPINSYFDLVGPEFDKFSIQRRREKHPAYTKMKADIEAGSLLPTITLAPPPDRAAEIKALVDVNSPERIADALVNGGHLNILDGLQRTYILKDISDAGHVFPEDQTVHLEIRIEPDIKHLIYRIIVLNAGQKPMSMRHQIELLFQSFQNFLQQNIANLELFTENDNLRRTRARKYALNKIAGGYHAFLLKSPEVDRQNVVAQKLTEESVLDSDENTLGQQFSDFAQYLSKYCQLDDEICRIYDGTTEGLPTGANWLGSENTINAFFGAVAEFTTTDARKSRTQRALQSLHNMLQSVEPGEDPLGLAKFNEIVEAFPVRKVNIGFATRKLVCTAFKEFFRDEGETPLAEIWAREAE